MAPPLRSSEWLKWYAQQFRPWPRCGRCDKEATIRVDYDAQGGRWFIVATCHGETEVVDVDEGVLRRLTRRDITLSTVFQGRLPGRGAAPAIEGPQRDARLEYIPEET